MRFYSSGCAWKKEQRLDSWILNSLQVHIQQDIIVLWPLKVYQLEIFWENEFLIYDINNVTHQSVWEYFIIYGVCTCLFLSSPGQESKHIISLNFRERRLKWGFCVSSAASWTLHGWVVTAALHFLKRHRLVHPTWIFPGACQQERCCWSWLHPQSLLPTWIILERAGSLCTHSTSLATAEIQNDPVEEIFQHYCNQVSFEFPSQSCCTWDGKQYQIACPWESRKCNTANIYT